MLVGGRFHSPKHNFPTGNGDQEDSPPELASHRYGCFPGPVESGMVVVLPTSPGDTPGGTPIIIAASEIGRSSLYQHRRAILLAETPMTFIASERGMVDNAGGRS